jgi:hypothetical protein
MRASLWRKRVKWLVRLKLPVNHFPGGTISCAPPSDAYLLRLSIAALKALVFDVFPSPTAPKSVKTALCFRQFIAGYCKVDETLALHSATRKLSIPNIRIAGIVRITCISKKIKSIFSVNFKFLLQILFGFCSCNNHFTERKEKKKSKKEVCKQNRCIKTGKFALE